MESPSDVKLDLTLFLPNVNMAFAFSKEIQVYSLKNKITFPHWMLWSVCKAQTLWEPLKPQRVNYDNQPLVRGTGWWLDSSPMLWLSKHRTAGADIIKTLLDREGLNFPKGNHVTQNNRRTCIVFLTWATHQEKKNTMQTQRCQAPLAVNAVRCAVTTQAETKVCGSAMERDWTDV